MFTEIWIQPSWTDCDFKKHIFSGLIMRKPKKKHAMLPGSQLIARGDVITMMDDDVPLKCLVLSCIGDDQGKCLATVEILEGPRKGERIGATLRAK